MQISVITRPIKLLPDIYKRVSHIALRCSVQWGDLVCKVWGAQEAEGRYSLLYRFRIAGDVPGQIRMRPVSPPFKYHRIAWCGTGASDAHIDVIDLGFRDGFTQLKQTEKTKSAGKFFFRQILFDIL